MADLSHLLDETDAGDETEVKKLRYIRMEPKAFRKFAQHAAQKQAQGQVWHKSTTDAIDAVAAMTADEKAEVREANPVT